MRRLLTFYRFPTQLPAADHGVRGSIMGLPGYKRDKAVG
jgi:hypothetical protein